MIMRQAQQQKVSDIEPVTLDISEMNHEADNCYTHVMPDPMGPGDSVTRPRVSRVLLWEDGHILGPAHSPHDAIRKEGRGAYSHWDRTLYFSSSDGTDPRTNGRLYQARLAVEPMAPCIYLNCLPKSGSDYLVNTLCALLQLPYLENAGGSFPDSYLVRDVFATADGGWVYRGHEAWNRYHKYQIMHYLDRMVVHLRDPRAAVLSYTHYAPILTSHSPTLAAYHGMDAGFASMTLEQKLDQMIGYLTPLMVSWIDSWLDAYKDTGFTTQILFTTYEQFMEDRNRYFSTLFEFYDLAPDDYLSALDEAAVKSVNFRKGETDEWRHVYTPVQRQRINEMIPDELLERFGWRR